MFDLTLSFDNGPTPEVTPHVLDVLCRHRVKSTFFVIGQKVAQHHALAERAHAEGHWIGNHTWSHSLPFGLMAADAAISEFCGAHCRATGTIPTAGSSARSLRSPRSPGA
jgi:peptidoglycan/xylan/chitin deacetylase (PgdA/CDA1 family)